MRPPAPSASMPAQAAAVASSGAADDGTVLICLHAWGAHGHPPPARPEADGHYVTISEA